MFCASDSFSCMRKTRKTKANARCLTKWKAKQKPGYAGNNWKKQKYGKGEKTRTLSRCRCKKPMQANPMMMMIKRKTPASFFEARESPQKISLFPFQIKCETQTHIAVTRALITCHPSTVQALREKTKGRWQRGAGEGPRPRSEERSRREVSLTDTWRSGDAMPFGAVVMSRVSRALVVEERGR